MSSFRERNDPKRQSGKNRAQKFAGGGKPAQTAGASAQARPQKQQTHQRHKVSDEGWIWGVHAVEAALKNPHREGPIRLFLSEDRASSLPQALLKRSDLGVTILPSADIARFLPQGAVHQGMAMNAPVPEGESLDVLLEMAPRDGMSVFLMLDQVTDPQNIGAIFRSAAAFGVSGLIMQDRHAPPLQGVLVKTAAGAADRVPFARVTNLSRALERLNEEGYVSIGLAGEGESNLHDLLAQQGWGESLKKLVLVLGSEGDGLRRLVAEHCDHLARIPMPGGFESLNVSHAASIALYEACARRSAEG